MKQLKFMLAAATAIGLATAAQAATQEVKLFGDETPVDTFTDGTPSASLKGYYYMTSETDDGENDSKVENGALTVSTGENPLLRALDLQGTTAVPVEMTATDFESLYIDTKVQFTVTPFGDSVKAGDNDKLMIYLAQCVDSVSDDGATTNFVNKLMVKALKYRSRYMDADLGYEVPGTEDPVDVAVTYEDGTTPNIVAGTWYDLRVETVLVGGVPMFTIKIGSALVKPAETLHLAEAGSIYFPSLTGTSDTTLQYVGFAGEGAVDNLTAVKLTVVNSVDFTFTWSDDKISAVTYTIGGGQPVPVTAGTAITANPEQVLTLTITPAAWYKLASDKAITYTVPATAPKDAMSLDDHVVAVASTGTDGKVTVTEGTTAADLGIATGSAFDKADATVLGNLMTWAMSKGGSTSATGAATLVGEMTFNADDTPKSDAAKAYLLDCAISEVNEKKEDFKLQISFNSDGLPVVEGPTGAATYKNGKIVFQGREKLSEGNWEPKAEGHKFFKAVLTK